MPQATNGTNNKMVFGTYAKAETIRDTSLQPFEAKTETFEFVLPEGVREAEITVSLRYFLLPPDNQFNIHTVSRHVSLDQ